MGKMVAHLVHSDRWTPGIREETSRENSVESQGYAARGQEEKTGMGVLSLLQREERSGSNMKNKVRYFAHSRSRLGRVKNH